MKKSIIIILILFVLASSGLAYYYYAKFSQVSSITQIQQASGNEVQDLVSKVGNLIVLPPNETPTVATVADLDALKSQPFFANAKLGDKVLIYSKAQKAILYDPVANKIVDIAPVNIASPAAVSPAATSAPSKKTTTTKKK